MNKLPVKSLDNLRNYCEIREYRGWDNFDGLNSVIFQNTPFFKSAIFRLAWIQIFKRSPINFRTISFVPKGYNAKGLALFISGLVSCGHYEKAKLLISHLKKMACSGYSGICWGYNFDWQSRSFYSPMGTPNIVTSVFVANAFLDFYQKTNKTSMLDIAIDTAKFILEHLILFENQNTLCFGYIPDSETRVHNANMLGASLLARIYSITGDSTFYEKSRKSMHYSMSALNPDYTWRYGEDGHHKFIDNFHTGFNLVSLNNWMEYTGDRIWAKELKKAYDYFLNTFWLDNGCPKYYNNSLYPIDIHCSAQGIITCIKLSTYYKDSFFLAKRIAEWAINNMQDEKGYFYYQKTRWSTNKIPYMRWSQAWMFYALSCYCSNEF